MQLTYSRYQDQKILFYGFTGSAAFLAFFLPLSISVYSTGIYLLLVLQLATLEYKAFWATIQKSAVFWSIAVFLLLVLIGDIYSMDKYNGFVDFRKYLKLLFIPILMPLFVDRKVRFLMINAFLAGVTVTVFCIYLKALGILHFRPSHLPSAGFSTHIETSYLIALACYFSLRLVKKEDKKTYAYGVLFAFLMSYLFVYNDGRMGQAVFVVLALLYCFQQFDTKKALWACLLVLCILLSAYFFVPLFHQHTNLGFAELQQALSGHANYGSIGSRYTMIMNSIELTKEALWFGHGSGSFVHAYDPARFGLPLDFVNVKSPQNDFLLVAVQLGLVGLVAYLMMFFLLFRCNQQLPQEMRYFAEANWVAIFVGQTFNDGLHLSIIGTTFVLFASVFLAANLEKNKRCV